MRCCAYRIHHHPAGCGSGWRAGNRGWEQTDSGTCAGGGGPAGGSSAELVFHALSRAGSEVSPRGLASRIPCRWHASLQRCGRWREREECRRGYLGTRGSVCGTVTSLGAPNDRDIGSLRGRGRRREPTAARRARRGRAGRESRQWGSCAAHNTSPAWFTNKKARHRRACQGRGLRGERAGAFQPRCVHHITKGEMHSA